MSDRRNMPKKSKINCVLLTAIIISILILVSFSSLVSESVAYTTAYEGAKPEFYGAKIYSRTIHKFDSNDNPYSYTIMGQTFTSNNSNGASAAEFDGTQMNFDPDDEQYYLPNLQGEMTSIFIPEKVTSFPTFVPREWTNQLPYINNPQNVYTWNLSSAGSSYTYRMEEWTTKWYVSISANPYTLQNGVAQPFSNAEGDGQRYNGVDIWFKLDISPSWYFEGQTRAYFAIAKIELSNLIKIGRDTNIISVNPESSGTSLSIYTSPFGSNATIDSTNTIKSYQGKVLNPAYFRNEVYTKISLVNFGTQSWWEWLTLHYQTDVVTFEFTVTQFVIGEWVVKDIQSDPGVNYGRDTMISNPSIYVPVLSDFSNAIASFLNNPFSMVILLLAGIALLLFSVATIFLVVLIYRKGAK